MNMFLRNSLFSTQGCGFLIVSALLSQSVSAEQHDFDTSFGDNGTNTIDVGQNTNPNAIDTYSDGLNRHWILIRRTPSTGDYEILVARFTENGFVDTGFGSGSGLLLLESGQNSNTSPILNTLVIDDARSRIYIGDRSNVRAYDFSGQLDTNFGQNGEAALGVSPRDATLDSQSRYLAVAESSTFNAVEFVRLSPAGVLDSQFGSGQARVFIPAGNSVSVSALQVSPVGNIFAVGESTDGSRPNDDGDILVVSVLEDGTPNTAFGNQAVVIHDTGDTSLSLRLRANSSSVDVGSIVFREENQVLTRLESFVTRFRLNGSLDTSFGLNGYVRQSISARNDPNGGTFFIGPRTLDSTDRAMESGFCRRCDNNSTNTKIYISAREGMSAISTATSSSNTSNQDNGGGGSISILWLACLIFGFGFVRWSAVAQSKIS